MLGKLLLLLAHTIGLAGGTRHVSIVASSMPEKDGLAIVEKYGGSARVVRRF
jgi:hypothetical protein